MLVVSGSAKGDTFPSNHFSSPESQGTRGGVLIGFTQTECSGLGFFLCCLRNVCLLAHTNKINVKSYFISLNLRIKDGRLIIFINTFVQSGVNIEIDVYIKYDIITFHL